MTELSEQAKELLREAAHSKSGLIRRSAGAGGRYSVTTNGKTFGDAAIPGDEARWAAAVRQLTACGLFEDRESAGVSFRITPGGCEVAKGLEDSLLANGKPAAKTRPDAHGERP